MAERVKGEGERFYMASHGPGKTETLEDFSAQTLTFQGESRMVFVSAGGPAVIVMSEILGISAEVARFARWVREAGFTVYMPNLFGEPFSRNTLGYVVKTIGRACIAREFAAFSSDSSGAFTDWLRALAALAHEESGGPGVGAVGMCIMGNFALSMMLEKAVLAPVMSQPALPVMKGAGMHIAPEELAAIRARLEQEDLTVRAYRFAGDPLCRAVRFDAYQAALGPRFEPRVLPDSAANTNARGAPHAVLTAHLIDAAGEPTREAADEVIAFLRTRLCAAS